ncbi:hypothetical protein RIF29_14967 [Crotalaria pallida]|uniref:Uncharacterized protein n=1 Tax=Crotalaria pallida TaxID=3830 RepID=A0AAN9FI57_CROPI
MHFSLPLSSSHHCQYSDLLGPGSPTVMRYPLIGTQLPVHGVSEDGHTRVEAEKQSITESILLDFETLDDLDLYSLTPKQAEKVLTALDDIRSKIVAKAADGSVNQKEVDTNKEKQTPTDKSNSTKKKEIELKEKLDSVQAQLRTNPTDVDLQMVERDVSVQYRKVQQDAIAFLKQKAKLLWTYY